MTLPAYRGQVNGSVQTTYHDQPGQAIAGMIAYVGDYNDLKSVFVGETAGVIAGRGVQAIRGDTAVTNFQRPNALVYYPDGDETAAMLYGIVCFNEAMQTDTDADGNPVNVWAKNRMALIARPGRAGCAVYVKAIDAVTEEVSTVNWVIAAGSDGKYQVGEFSPSVLNSGTVGTTVAIANAKFASSSAAGGLVILELLGTVIPVFDASV